jgi:hypothetical protein
MARAWLAGAKCGASGEYMGQWHSAQYSVATQIFQELDDTSEQCPYSSAQFSFSVYKDQA